MPSKQAIADIIWAYRKKIGANNGPLPLRELAVALNEQLNSIGGHISHQSLSNWENQVHVPSSLTIMQLIQLANQVGLGWQVDFAQDLLAILKPRQFSPATSIGKKALKQLHKRTHNPRASKPPSRKPPSSPGAGG
ncbi:MAG: hypothetical protein DWQ07_04820 [Chloroflexi bacterium]|nr:MAG: hypothetical protein DWQ07_04820 [Chloroflexota bacterium]MBL1194754.1 hypothetical protein [Chloroflexota bacterium]NOH12046.1 hypothetical protein [Chloroflexota bacterium]